VPASRSEPGFAFLRLLHRLLGSLPLVHVDYASGALPRSILCATAYSTIHDIAAHFAGGFPHLDVLRE